MLHRLPVYTIKSIDTVLVLVLALVLLLMGGWN
jgi:hypothetical protein